MDRKGGGARRGPFVNKRVPFATRLTPETMEALAKAAEKDEQSISQKAEEMLLLSLRAQSLVDRELGPLIEALRTSTTMAVLTAGPTDGPAEVERVRQVLLAALPHPARSSKASEAKPASGVRRQGRQLNVDD